MRKISFVDESTKHIPNDLSVLSFSKKSVVHQQEQSNVTLRVNRHVWYFPSVADYLPRLL